MSNRGALGFEPIARFKRMLSSLRGPAAGALACLFLTSTSGAGVVNQEQPGREFTEYEVKAEFIERLTNFVDWPDSAFANASSEFTFCTWGYGPLTRQLERALPRGRVKARTARLLHVATTEQLNNCHVLYVVSADRNAIRTLARYLWGRPVLSVGDQPGLADDGLLVNLVLTADSHVRIELNQSVARASGLKVSAKLMQLARLVGRSQ